MDEPAVKGQCPSCGRRTLRLMYDGAIACTNSECPRPRAVEELLDEAYILDHIVELRRHDFTLKHPMVERLGGRLFNCPAGEWLSRSDGAPHALGKYRMTRSDPGWRFEAIEPEK